jgi:IMP dehydrogenase
VTRTVISNFLKREANVIVASEAFTYDDLMLIPQYSNIKSRKEPDVSTVLGNTKLEIPIISAPMNTVTEYEMCQTMGVLGGSAVLHRYLTIDEQIKQFITSTVHTPFNVSTPYSPFVAVGATGDWLERAGALYDAGARRFCIDVANGHSLMCIEATTRLRSRFGGDIDIMAGNVCSHQGARMLAEAGANIIRVGIGPGSACTTRLVTGHGVPQLTAINECESAKYNPTDAYMNVAIVADGGIRSSGDVVKALAMGADAVMIGGLIAGTSQSPGDTKNNRDYTLYKDFHGMASEGGRSAWFDKESTSFIPEGTSMKVMFKGDAKRIVEDLIGGLRVGMSYSGARTLEELRENAQWCRVSENGRIEGTPNRKMFR